MLILYYIDIMMALKTTDGSMQILDSLHNATRTMHVCISAGVALFISVKFICHNFLVYFFNCLYRSRK